jgi:hypothetical protein
VLPGWRRAQGAPHGTPPPRLALLAIGQAIRTCTEASDGAHQACPLLDGASRRAAAMLRDIDRQAPCLEAAYSARRRHHPGCATLRHGGPMHAGRRHEPPGGRSEATQGARPLRPCGESRLGTSSGGGSRQHAHARRLLVFGRFLRLAVRGADFALPCGQSSDARDEQDQPA